ncbi:hypothetical protein EJ08DRAFT_235692 [Tothia fuscella]|uniref:Calcium-channel protein CCH1 n=1 Tax=Tothia fuscella TaxID=1048955 RepID=A0A9P4NRU2_9PEZI|nr:hypothetical protein EJ08DRAFT_235692 [Tothia fuscella]
MDFNDPNHRRNISTPEIPLQDLTKSTVRNGGRQQESGSSSGGSSEEPPGRARAISDIVRNRLSGGRNIPRGYGGLYAPIAERDPDTGRVIGGGLGGATHLAIPGRNSHAGHQTGGNVEASPTSPVDVAGFQQAIGGFAGLSFTPAGPSTEPVASNWANNTSTSSLATLPDAGPGATPSENGDSGDYFTQSSSDRTPLTDSRHLQPIAGSSLPTSPTPSAKRSDRTRSVRFSDVGITPAFASRLGDDLNQAETGGIRRSGSLRRSLSPNATGSTLQRAGTIVRNMSTRIVNLSNEQDVVDRTIRRKSSSVRERTRSVQSSLTGDVVHVDGGSDQDGGRVEKVPSVEAVESVPNRSSSRTMRSMNPLKGNSLGIFPPDSTIRMKLCDLLVHPVTEPTIFILIVVQAILLAIDSSRNIDYNDSDAFTWGRTWIDYVFMGLFGIYTAEIVTRSIVSGFIVNPTEYSTINRQIGVRQAIWEKAREVFGSTPHNRPPRPGVGSFDPNSADPQQPSIMRSFTSNMQDPEVKGGSRQKQRQRLAHRAFLRHSFNRLDFLAVVSYWISIVLSISKIEGTRHIFVFRMLSCLRILRLLYLTSGTTVILRSLKKAAGLLTNVAVLIGFFWLLFAIVGLQSFKSSLKRNCVWFEPGNPSNNFTNSFQFCGGWLAPNGSAMPWQKLQNGVLSNGADTHKGFLCPINSRCIEGMSPYNGTVSFDNIFQSLELVFVMMSSNTFSDIMYYLTDSDYLAAALFFAAGIVIMFFWLVNLLIAVITSSFQVIREEGKVSAFTGEESGSIHLGAEEDSRGVEPRKPRMSTVKRIYDKSRWFWIALIAFGLVVQCLRSATMGKAREHFIENVETFITFVLLLEIVLRFMTDWRHFFRSKRNIADLALAVITSIIQLPPIRNSGQPYAWLTIFQILRVYRVVLAVPITRDLIMTVLGNFSGLLNLILFVFLLTFLAAILAAQMFRGSLPQQNSSGNTIKITFDSLYNSFLGMYQIFSSENWTTMVYSVTNYDVFFNTAWMGAAFFILWFILANFIVLNMFIAVIQENFDISEDDKRLQQVKAFLQQRELGVGGNGNLSLSSIFKFGAVTGRKRDPLAFGSATTEMLLKDAVVKDFLDEQEDPTPLSNQQMEEAQPPLRAAPTTHVVDTGTMSSLWGRFVRKFQHREPNPFYSRLEFSRAYEDLDPRQMAKEVMSARDRRKRAQRDYLRKHPNYNVSLFLFKPHNALRKLCQRIVGPGRGGDRIDGVAPSVPVWYAFSAFIYCAVVAMVILACVTTPLYQKEYFKNQPFSVRNWFVFSDMGFAILFTVEAAIKVIADGFFFTPNAYFRGSWGFIDGVVLVTLWISVATALYNEGQVSRAVGAFKALRALRLLNVSDSARNNFHSVIVRGGVKVASAAFVSISLLVPFAVYGLNLFVGKMQSCNDSGPTPQSGFLAPISNLNDCVGEYMTNSSPSNWNILAPRVVSNPYYSFDNFSDALFILFQIVSQEGWVDVMWQAISITGVGQQPKDFSNYGYAVFFVVFNLLGAVFVLTLFVSVFMRNYTEQTGVAFLTADQRSWLELRKLLRQISPSKRPLANQKREDWKEWCYRRAVRKTGRWQRVVTGTLVLHLTLLCVEFYPPSDVWDTSRDYIFLAFVLVYIANLLIRFIGLTWPRFRRSSWDLYGVLSVGAAFVTSILAIAQPSNWVIIRLHKLSLVSIALLIIPRNNQLDQLFKTAAASLPLILNLLATWFVLFLTFAIALTQTFGLTKFNNNESGNVNFRNVPKALILLFRMSVGEGWNQIMEDFASMRPPYCVVGESFREGDCGSPEWARFLFIAWNILSMYIFVNLFVSLIYESFSYVYQRSSGLSVISREEIRRFKQAWAEFDPDGTGFISKEAFPKLLGELSGVFEMRIYDGDFTIARLIEDCSRPRRESGLPVEGTVEPHEIDIHKLNARLAELPIREIRRRRARMNKFHEEVLVSSDPDKGIAFTSLLMILAHYKVINDNRSLRLHEFLRRRARLQRVDEAVRRNVVIGFFDTVYWNRKFRNHIKSKHAGRMTVVPQFTVPEIFVDDEGVNDDNTHLVSPFDGQDLSSFGPPSLGSSAPSSPRHGAITPPEGGSDYGGPSSSGRHLRSQPSVNSIQTTPTGSPTRSRGGGPFHEHSNSNISDDWHIAAAISRPTSPLGVHGSDDGGHSRSRAVSNVSARDVLDVLDNSAWGESIRKSYSTRRASGGGGDGRR